jgi:hypothetical protein
VLSPNASEFAIEEKCSQDIYGDWIANSVTHVLDNQLNFVVSLEGLTQPQWLDQETLIGMRLRRSNYLFKDDNNFGFVTQKINKHSSPVYILGNLSGGVLGQSYIAERGYFPLAIFPLNESIDRQPEKFFGLLLLNQENNSLNFKWVKQSNFETIFEKTVSREYSPKSVINAQFKNNKLYFKELKKIEHQIYVSFKEWDFIHDIILTAFTSKLIQNERKNNIVSIKDNWAIFAQRWNGDSLKFLNFDTHSVESINIPNCPPPNEDEFPTQDSEDLGIIAMRRLTNLQSNVLKRCVYYKRGRPEYRELIISMDSEWNP